MLAVFAILLFLLCMIFRYVYKMINWSRLCGKNDHKQRIEHCSELPQTLGEEQRAQENVLDHSRDEEKAALRTNLMDQQVNKDSSSYVNGREQAKPELQVDKVVTQQLTQEQMTPSGSSHKKTKSNAVAPYQVHEFTGYDMRRESGVTQMTHGGAQDADPNRTESLMPPMGKDSNFIRSSSGGENGDDNVLVDLKGNSSAGTSNEHVHETRGRGMQAATDQSKNILSETADRPLADVVVSAAFEERGTSNDSRAYKQRRNNDDTIVTDERRLTKENFNDTIDQQEG